MIDLGRYDIVIIGGGILGAASALRLRAGGMKPIVIEQNEMGQGASGVNAGTLSLQIKRVKLMPYALRGHQHWQHMGRAVGFRKTGGYTLAFNEREATLLEERMALKRDAGAPIQLVSTKTLAAAEPRLCSAVVAASYCSEDGYANASLTGQYYRDALRDADIPVLENSEVQNIQRTHSEYRVESSRGVVCGQRILLACGAWLKSVAAMLDIDLPVQVRVNTLSVTERSPELFSSVIGHATGQLTMKQKTNGTILIGGGWQGRGNPSEGRGQVVAESLLPNLRLAQYAVPALSSLRIVRSWTGFEANVPDFYPLAGALPGLPDAYVLGCVRGGYTIGPYIGELMGDLILGRTPELPLFDPGRSYDSA
jgi:sarcosine oxidase subunit beta